MASRLPIVGQWYSVICPACYANIIFDCRSLSTYGIQCSVCHSVIDLRNPTSLLPDGDSGQWPEGSEKVLYSPDVEDSDGLPAVAQVSLLIRNLEEEKLKVMPATMSGETTQAFSAQRSQAIADKFLFLSPVTHLIEYLVFGTEPVAKIGHVRIFRKKLPFYGYVNIPVPRTSTSYAAPLCFTTTEFIGTIWLTYVIDQAWMWRNLRFLCVFVVLFYVMLFRLVYSDPGFIRPGYVAEDGREPDQITLKDIENNQRDSMWENVNGVPMERKWCATCNMYRPVRAAHCYLCGFCCLDHDHHCGVIGVCVGRRRIELFAAFVTVSATAVTLPAISIILCWLWHMDRLSSVQFYITVVMCIPMLFFTVILTPTSVSMWMSSILESTTRERLQNVYASKRNPFSRGALRNCIYHLCQRRVEPSLFDDDFVKECAMRYEKRKQRDGHTVTCI